MTDDERDTLLIRVDERTGVLHEWIKTHEELHKEQRSYFHKWLGILTTSIIGIVVKILFWK